MADYSKHKIEGLEGICVLYEHEQHARLAASEINSWCQALGAQAYLNIALISYQGQSVVHVTAAPVLHDLTPDYRTIHLSKTLGLDTINQPEHLDLEILLCLSRSPIAYCFPSIAELKAAVRVRHFAVDAARRTELAFNPDGFERPKECWTYVEGSGFLLNPGADMVEALIKTTQPEVSGQQLYTFSCGRAAEYIMLLSIAQELKLHNPELYAALQKQWQTRALLADDFNDAFIYEVGTLEKPLPMQFYVPGCRLWFRNPDSHSADVEGFEGSWVVYHGGGEFCNLWERTKPFTMIDKCLEIYHWRNGVFYDADGVLKMNEDIVRDKVAETKKSAVETNRIVAKMMRYRDVRGVYQEGGCIDASRDVVRWVCPNTSDLVLGT
ncbi:MAG: hypothetical protein NBV66_06885 [Burkholderiaceae bacterium]|nr:hypothetical protein [Burkholderiaceae bacterium]